jgi:replication factor C subunit 3/5
MISEVGNNDRAVIQELLKEIAQTQQVDLNAKQRFKGPSCSPARGCEAAHARPVVIINEADSLTRDAQAALRRTMEKYTTNMRMILCANSTSRLIAPIKSRCLLIRVAAPDEVEVKALSSRRCYFRTDSFPDAQGIGVRGQARKVRPSARSRVRDCSGRQRQPTQGVARARGAQDAVVRPRELSSFSLGSLALRPDLSGPLSIAKPDWETYCHKVADMIVQEQSPDRVMAVRAKFYELLTHCIPPTVIMKTVADRVVERVDEPLKADIMHWAAIYVRVVFFSRAK